MWHCIGIELTPNQVGCWASDYETGRRLTFGKCKDFPQCHIDLLLRRFFKVKNFFLANHLNEEMQEKQKEIRENNYGSRTMMAHRANKK